MIKIRYLDRELEPRFKCGAGAAVALGVGSLAAGLIGSGISAASSASIANKNISAQRDENSLNRDWQTAEAEKARQYNTSERLGSQQYGIDVMNMMNEYNNPLNQARRLQSAGINPAIAMQGGTQNVSASSQPSSPASSPVPSPVGGLSPVSQQPLDLQIPQLMNGLSSMLSGLANAKKAGVETSYLEKSMDLNLRNLSAEASLKELTATGIQLDNAIKSADMPYAWERAYNRYKKEAYEAGVAFEMQGKIKNEAALAAAEKDLAEASAKLKTTEQQLVAQDVAYYVPKLRSSLMLQGAQTNAANAGARKASAEATFQEFTNKMRDHFSVQEYDSYISRLQKDNILSEAEAAEAKRRLDVIKNLSGNEFIKKLDESLEWIKGKISIFSK